MSPAEASLVDRLGEAARAAATLTAELNVGPRWFQLGRSRKDALKKEVRLEDVSTQNKSCRRVELADNEAYWAMNIWNGRSEGQEANLAFSLFERQTRPDGLMVSAEIDHLRGTVGWPGVLAATRELANALGGCAIVTSHEARERETEHNSPAADHTAYAAFWGIDRSGRNPLYRWLTDQGRMAPWETLACESWAEVETPDLARLRRISNDLSTVSIKAGEGIRT